MSDKEELSRVEAIRQIIAEGSAMDYVDVVDQVRKRFGLTVSTSLVEEVYLEQKRDTHLKVEPRLSADVPSPSETAATTGGDAGSQEVDSVVDDATHPDSHLLHALTFVKSVHGLANAKAALAELEAIMRQDG